MNKKYKDWILGFLLSAIIFFGIVLLDRIEDIQRVSPYILFFICIIVLSQSIRFIKWVFKW